IKTHQIRPTDKDKVHEHTLPATKHNSQALNPTMPPQTTPTNQTNTTQTTQPAVSDRHDKIRTAADIL
ncbi:hypothetical protein, partial [Pseudomonas syringae group genomosp. 7]|uniref:hypothetical protein n=1 Tax=Pseudomonas syringae group genomosp. 7 TaxID=251699 RepID=UPI00376F6A9A